MRESVLASPRRWRSSPSDRLRWVREAEPVGYAAHALGADAEADAKWGHRKVWALYRFDGHLVSPSSPSVRPSRPLGCDVTGDERAVLLTLADACGGSGAVDVEDMQGKLLVPRENERRLVHHLQPSSQHVVVGKRAETSGVGVEVRILVVDPVRAMLGNQDGVGVELGCSLRGGIVGGDVRLSDPAARITIFPLTRWLIARSRMYGSATALMGMAVITRMS